MFSLLSDGSVSSARRRFLRLASGVGVGAAVVSGTGLLFSQAASAETVTDCWCRKVLFRESWHVQDFCRVQNLPIHGIRRLTVVTVS